MRWRFFHLTFFYTIQIVWTIFPHQKKDQHLKFHQIAQHILFCLHGVDTLKAMAYNIQLEGRVLSPVLDAQKGNFYQALYEWRNGELVELAPVEVVSAEKALERIALQGTPALLLGECTKLAKNGLPDFISVAPEALRMPKGSSVALAALAEFDAENDKKIFGLEPYYIRRSEAEELWEKKHKQQ